MRHAQLEIAHIALVKIVIAQRVLVTKHVIEINYATAPCGAQWEHDILGAAFLGFAQVGASYRTQVKQLGSFLIAAFMLKLLHVYAGLTETICILQTLLDWRFSQFEQLFPILIDI